MHGHGLGECIPDQKAVLVQIRTQLSYNSSLSFKLVLWDERVDCCQWPGVSCNDAGYIIGVDLSYEPITGGANNAIFLLKHLPSLSVIRLDWVNFSAPFPDLFTDFTNLTVLSLKSCNFSGTVPHKVFQVPTLQTIDLTWNKMLEGSIPSFKMFKNLTRIGLSYNEFTGEIPSSHWDGLNHLQNLYLEGNSFSGPIPVSLFFLPSLTTLSLFKNKFSGHINELQNVTSQLMDLDLSGNNLEGSIPSFFFRLQNLKLLSLSSNKFSGRIIDLQNVTSQLEFLDLIDNNLEGTMPSFFFQLPNLTSLYLSSNKFSGQIIDLQNVTSQLRDLDLSNNNLEGPIPSFFFQLQNLTTLYLSSNKFNGTVHLTRFKNPENIWFLDISHNSLAVETNIRAAELPILPEFRILKLASCNLQKFPDFLKNQSKLQMLDLSSNAISGEIPEWISEMVDIFHDHRVWPCTWTSPTTVSPLCLLILVINSQMSVSFPLQTIELVEPSHFHGAMQTFLKCLICPITLCMAQYHHVWFKITANSLL
nr:receptor-like protein 12 [Ipomoea batatas]